VGEKGSGRGEDKPFYVYDVSTEMGRMVYIYDREIIENRLIRDARYNKVCSEDEAAEIVKGAVSLTFYGERAVRLGISLGYIHPEAVGYLNGVRVAMYMRMY
jgi:hypothetical protein